MRLLVVALPGSPHTVRYLNQFADQNWDVRLFATDFLPIHPGYKLKNLRIYHFGGARPEGLDPRIRIHSYWPIRPGMNFSYELYRRFAPDYLKPARRLARLIQRFQPDAIHSLSMVPASVLVHQAKLALGPDYRFPPWIVTNWGLDIHWYRHLDEYNTKLRGVLADADHYTCECHRDIGLADEMGFRGQHWPVLPNAGGFDLSAIAKLRQPGPTSKRRTIVVKGYHGMYARAQVALRGIELARDHLHGYRIVFFGPDPEMKVVLQHFRNSTGIPIEIAGPMTHDEMLKLHGSARMSIGMSTTDGVATSFLEALVMGSFPIQSWTACADEWAENGKNAFLVHPDDPADLAAVIKRAAADDDLVDQAATINYRIAMQRLNHDNIKKQFLLMYEQILNPRQRSASPPALQRVA